MKKRTGALLMALVMIFGLMAPAASAVETGTAVEAVYLGVKDMAALNVKNSGVDESDFVHLFFVDGEEEEYTIADTKEYAIQNKLMEGYIYNITVEDDVVTGVELQDKGTIIMGEVTGRAYGTGDDDVMDYELDVEDETEIDVTDKAYYEITTQSGGATITEIDFMEIELGDTVKITDKAVYKTFVAEDYESPVDYTPGEKTLKNFLAAALQPVGTTLYVFGAGWDWEDSETANTAMTIGISQSWVDFFQSQDLSYHYKQKDANGSHANSYYTSTGGWNQYYYAGLDCSGYVGWAVYNTLHDESTTGDQFEGYVCDSTNQAKMLADLGLGTYDRGTQKMNADGTIYTDGDGDTHRIFDTTDFSVGDIFSDNGHAWICLGTCEDGSMVFLHSTPSSANYGSGEGGGVQISALNPYDSSDTNCEAYELAEHYMSIYYPDWCERYSAVVRGSSFIDVWDGGVPGTEGYSEKKAGKFSWDLEDVLTDPDHYADMTPAEILADLYGEFSGEAVYLGVEDFGDLDTDDIDESEFVHKFFMDGEVVSYQIESDADYSVQNKLMEGYIYDVTGRLGKIVDVELKTNRVTTGMYGELYADDVEGKPVYEITTQAGGATVTEIALADLAADDTVKVTENAVYKTFVASDYTSPVKYTPGQTTLRNFLATALHPVGTALYVYGGAWDWQDDVSSNQSMTIGIPQSWIDFFQSQDTSYDFKHEDENGKAGIPSYYTSNRGWNQYYYAGVDCSAYTGWIIYNITNTESSTNNADGYVGSSTKQAYNFAQEGWGEWNHDTAALAAAGELKVGDIVSMSGHVWVVLGVCNDGSIVFMHSTPSNSRDGYPGGGIQIASLNPNGQSETDCEAYKLADYYMSKYYPAWYKRYPISQKSYTSYLQTYGGTGNAGKYAGVMHWTLDGTGLLTDPDGFADMSAAEILAYIFGEEEHVVEHEAVYLGVKNFAELDTDNVSEDEFIHQFAIDGVATDFVVGTGKPYTIQNQLMEGYIYNITTTDGVITAVELQDKGDIAMGTVKELKDTFGEKPVYEITTQAGGATVTKIEASALKSADTVKVTENAVYKAFVAEDYEAPVAGTPGVTTLKNFLTTALQPVGTAVYVYGGAWDWQDDVSSNQSMTIGIPQSWIDFFQAQDGTYHYKQTDASGSYANSYYTSNRGWNQYYYAGVDCSAYTGWIIYNITNTESSTDNADGYVGSATKQAKNLAAKGWGTWNHDTAAVAAAGELKVGDIVSMSGHVWVVLGVCDDGSVVFMHSTPSDSRDGYAGGGIQIASLNPNGQDKYNCEAYKLADYYMSTYYPQWYDRYAISQKSYSSYLQTYTSGTAGTWAGVFSWDLSGNALLSDPEGYADMTPAQILMDIFGDDGIPAGSSSKPAINKDAEASEPSTEVEETTTTYTDVPETHWAYEAIEAVSEAGLFNGTSATTFSPEAATTRGQLMTVLARLSGEKAATIAEGVAWAVENGISDGTAADAQITREQLVTMLYRYAQLKGIDVSVGENTNILSYTDAEAISEYAISAMQWACGAGIINGMTADTLAPAGTATRAQIATIMQRYAGL